MNAIYPNGETNTHSGKVMLDVRITSTHQLKQVELSVESE